MQRVENMEEGSIVLIETDAKSSLNVGMKTIKTLTGRDYTGVILTASRPYDHLIKLYKKNHINISKLFFLDCISKSQSNSLESAENVLYLDSVSSLTNISIAINKALEVISGKKFLFIDSISTMLIYNKPEIYARFIHGILTRLRMDNVCGILLSLKEDTSPQVHAEIAQLCDLIINK